MSEIHTSENRRQPRLVAKTDRNDPNLEKPPKMNPQGGRRPNDEVRKLRRLVKEKDQTIERLHREQIDELDQLESHYRKLLEEDDLEIRSLRSDLARKTNRSNAERSNFLDLLEKKEGRLLTLARDNDHFRLELERIGVERDNLKNSAARLEELYNKHLKDSEHLKDKEVLLLNERVKLDRLVAELQRKIEEKERIIAGLTNFLPLKILATIDHQISTIGIRVPKLAFLYAVDALTTKYMGYWEQKMKKRIFP